MIEIEITKKELMEINGALGVLYTYSTPAEEALQDKLTEVYRKAQTIKGENKDFFMEQYQRLFSKRLPIQYQIGRSLDSMEEEVKAFNAAHQKIREIFADKNEDGTIKKIGELVQFGDNKEEADKEFEILLNEMVKIKVYPIKEEVIEKLDVQYVFFKPLIGKIIV